LCANLFIYSFHSRYLYKNEYYENLSNNLINTVLDILNDKEKWKLEKELEANMSETSQKMSIYTKNIENIGKVTKLETFLQTSDKSIVKILRDDIDAYSKWSFGVRSMKVNILPLIYSLYYC
jgi:hypothetical protein